MRRITETRRGRLVVVLATYLGALLACYLLGGFFRADVYGWQEIGFLALLALAFPEGFGYHKLQQLGPLPYLTYLGLAVALVMTSKQSRFWKLFAAFAALLVLNVHGCVYTDHYMS